MVGGKFMKFNIINIIKDRIKMKEFLKIQKDCRFCQINCNKIHRKCCHKENWDIRSNNQHQQYSKKCMEKFCPLIKMREENEIL